MQRSDDYLSLGEMFEERGKYFKAERLYKKALKHKDREVGARSPELIPYLYNLAMIQAALDRVSEYTGTFGRLLDLLIAERGESDKEVLEIRDVLSELHSQEYDMVMHA